MLFYNNLVPRVCHRSTRMMRRRRGLIQLGVISQQPSSPAQYATRVFNAPCTNSSLLGQIFHTPCSNSSIVGQVFYTSYSNSSYENLSINEHCRSNLLHSLPHQTIQIESFILPTPIRALQAKSSTLPVPIEHCRSSVPHYLHHLT